jgi:superfamily II DNA or RNA helicase
MKPEGIQVNEIFESDCWPEPVRVLHLQAFGELVQIEAVGTRTQRFYSRIFSPSDLARIQRISSTAQDFRGNPEAFFLAIESHRIRYVQQFDPLFAVNVSQIEPLPHQIEAVYFYILRNPKIRFLLADDPGAGKTIMAGLLLKELKYRGLVHRALIVVPSHLKDQWLREMKERFGESFVIVDRGVMNATWGRNVWQEHSHVLTSMDFAKQDDVMATLAEATWDIAIVDEAHKLAAYRYGTKITKRDRYRLGELLSRTSQFLLFLTATPHRGDPENFRLFLDLLEPGFFASTDLLAKSVQDRDNPLFLRRLKEDLCDFERRPLFLKRYVYTIKYYLSDDEKQLYNAVTTYVERSYNKALAAEKRNVAFALLILQRRLASSVRAVRRSLERRRARLEQLLRLGQWLAQHEEIDEDALEDAEEIERLRQEEELVERLTAAETREELQAEISQLEELIRLAKQAERREIERKLEELRTVMEEERIRQTGEKLLIFTESRETLDYLVEKLKAWGYSVVALHGGMNLDARIRAEHEFREQAQVMVSTEAGGEGINLQFCSLMVNYDIPWNPNRLEQRMGRIHRYGQTKEVHIYNLVALDTREGKVLDALFRKLAQIQEALGSDRVFDVIGEVLPGRSLKELIVEAIANRRTLDEIIREIEAVPNQEAVERVRQVALEGLAMRHIDLQRVLGEERMARENRLVPEYIKKFFERACRLLGISLEQRADGLWRVPHVPYELRNLPRSFKDRYGEVFSSYSKIAFEKSQARLSQAIFIAPGHPLLEAIIEQLFARYASDLRRGAFFADPDSKLEGFLWFLEAEIRDGRNEIAGKRLFAIYQPIRGEWRLIHPAILWDLKPLTPEESGALPAAPISLDEGQAVAFTIQTALEGYRQELQARRERDAVIKRKYGLRSLEQLILDSEAKLIDYETRRAQGENIPEPTVQNEQRRKEELEERKRALEETIQREVSLSPATPRILGVARVIPAQLVDGVAKEMHSDPEIEAIGMEIAMRHERADGRTPEDLSKQNLGFDIRSIAGDGKVRYIEVKARARTGAIALTPNEWLMAQRLGDDYWLYVVENAATEPTLHRIQNPAAKLKPQEVVGIVRYVVNDWKTAAEMSEEE